MIDVLAEFWSNHWIAAIVVGCAYLVMLAIMVNTCLECEWTTRLATESELQSYREKRDAELEDWISTLDMDRKLVAVRAQVATSEELADPSKQFRDDLRRLRESGDIPNKLRRKLDGRPDYTIHDLERVRSFGRLVLSVYSILILWVFSIWSSQMFFAVEFLDVESSDVTGFPILPICIGVVSTLYIALTSHTPLQYGFGAGD